LGAKKFWKIPGNHPWPLLSNRAKRCLHVAEVQGTKGLPQKRISYCLRTTMNEKRREVRCKGNLKYLTKTAEGSVKVPGNTVGMIP
jgi:hypothetical protein